MSDTHPANGTEDFNFWPSFADTMLGIVLALVVVLFLMSTALGLGRDFSSIERRQVDFLKDLRREISGIPINTPLVPSDTLIRPGTGMEYIYIIGNPAKGVRAYREYAVVRLTLSDILFEFGSDRLSALAAALLQEVGQVVQRHVKGVVKIDIEGHTDNVSPRDRPNFNWDLGARRAVAVYDALARAGYINTQDADIAVASYGDTRPVYLRNSEAAPTRPEIERANASAADRALNRRVELRLEFGDEE